MVEARKPEARVGVLALRPRVLGPVLDEVQPAPRVFDRIAYVEHELFAAAQRRFHHDLQLLAGAAERQRRTVGAVAPHRGDVQVDRVEHEPADAVFDGTHRRRAVRVQPPALDIGTQIEVDVQDVDDFVGAVVQPRAG